jgi:hypothetical protein
VKDLVAEDLVAGDLVAEELVADDLIAEDLGLGTFCSAMRCGLSGFLLERKL